VWRCGHDECLESLLCVSSEKITPVLWPMMIEEDIGQASGGIVTGFVATEAVVGTLNSLYSTADGGDG